MSEPTTALSADALAAIRARHEAYEQAHPEGGSYATEALHAEVVALLAEVERLTTAHAASERLRLTLAATLNETVPRAVELRRERDALAARLAAAEAATSRMVDEETTAAILHELEHGTPDTPERVALFKLADAIYAKFGGAAPRTTTREDTTDAE